MPMTSPHHHLLYCPSTDHAFSHVQRYTAAASRGRVKADCLFRYDEPVSPHLAVGMRAGSTVWSHHRRTL